MPAGLDPISALPSAVQTVAGITQSIIGGIKQHKAIKSLEALKTPSYAPNKAIGDYYQTSLNRYNTNPYQSEEYQYAKKSADNALGAGISALGDRRNALAGVAGLVSATDNNMDRAAVNAQQQKNAAFAGLDNATGMKAADDMNVFKYNVLAPYEKKANLLSMKAAAGGQMLNAGLSNISGGLNNASMLTTAGADGGNYSTPTAMPSYGGLQGNQIPGSYSQYGATYLPAGLRYR